MAAVGHGSRCTANRYLDPTLAFGDTVGILAVRIQFGLACAVLLFELDRLTHVNEDLEAI